MTVLQAIGMINRHLKATHKPQRSLMNNRPTQSPPITRIKTATLGVRVHRVTNEAIQRGRIRVAADTFYCARLEGGETLCLFLPKRRLSTIGV